MTPELEMSVIEADASEVPADATDTGLGEIETAQSRTNRPVRAKNGSTALESRSKSTRETPEKAAAVVWTVIEIPVAQIGPNPFQPRLSFDEGEMSDLTASVRAHGVLQPVSVRTAPDVQARGKTPLPPYHLIAGERRLRACRAAARKTIPAIVRDDLSDAQAAELAVVENVQRANLSVIEEAKAYKRLMIEFHLKEERIAKKVGKSLQVVRDTLKLLALPQAVQEMLAKKQLTASHGHLLLKLAPFNELCVSVASHAEGSGMTATALGQNLLPNIRQLRDKKLVVDIDYRTKFDWKNVCGQCPHKAYLNIGYNSYCAKPEEWARKQTEAIELQKQEAARVLEEARNQANESGAVDISLLPSGTFRDLSYGRPPAGCCESCPCRAKGVHLNDPTRPRPICMDIDRYKGLVEAEREAVEQERQNRGRALYEEATARLQGEPERVFVLSGGEFQEIAALPSPATKGSPLPKVRAGDAAVSDDLVSVTIASGATVSNAVAALAVWPFLSGATLNFGERQCWGQMMAGVDEEMARRIPWLLWQEDAIDHAEYLARLREIEPERLLEFAAHLLLAQEAVRVTRTGGQTPLLDAVLGRVPTIQQEFGDEFADDGAYDEAEGYEESDDYEFDDYETEESELDDHEMENPRLGVVASVPGPVDSSGEDPDASGGGADEAEVDAWNDTGACDGRMSSRRDDEPYLMGLQRVEIGRQARQRAAANASLGGDGAPNGDIQPDD